ncbi:MAG: tetratricopeptide repeat protein [Prevotella sp.]|nr:tetratricopeptide repeat protein [Prevotella sp.]
MSDKHFSFNFWRLQRWFLAVAVGLLVAVPFMARQPEDSERLGMALEYFQSGKYHEALLLFEQLDKEYSLNPRYHAYMGVCHYYEWEYEEACQLLDEAIPKLEAFAPHERSVYYFTNGESHFQLKQYAEAIPFFEKALTVCYENEKGDIHYRLGMCHMFAEEWLSARDHYRQALDNYVALRNTPDMQPRIYQTSHMMKGCEQHLKGELLTEKDFGSATVSDSTTVVAEFSDTTAVANTSDIVETANTTTSASVSDSPAVSPEDSVNLSSTIKKVSSTDSVAMASARSVFHRDTIRQAIPTTINIQDLFNRQVEVKE